MDIVTTPSVHVIGEDRPGSEGDVRVAVSDESVRPTPSGRDVTDLRRHIPRIALDWDDDAPGRAWQQVDASLVFADISGFTALTEKLARRGRIGAEELIETLNRVFGAMLTQAAIRGGELLKFGGDALLFTFRGDDHAARACRSAVDMRQALREAAKVPTSVGRLTLSMSVGIHSGRVDFFLVGAPTRELLILGDAGTSTAEAEHAAVAGEILVTEGTAQHLPPGSTDLREDGLHKLKWRFTYPPEGEGPPTPDVSQERIVGLFPHALGDYLADRVPDPEHKVATIGFARFSGTDRMLRDEGHDAVADVLHETMTVFEEAMIAEGISLLATDIDSDGGKLFMGSGVPYTTEDDEGRMLRAMRRVLDHGTPLPVQIGVNRGHVFVAEVGTLNRSAYSAMGDTTNTAARIMSKAGAGVLFAHPEVTENSRTLFATEVAGPFPMKGKAVPVLVHDVGPDLGTREALRRTSLPLVGREVEIATVRGALERALSGEGGVITVAAGTGLGKSRLIQDAMDGIEATVVTVRAEPYGMTSPYRMLRDPLREAFGVARDEPDVMTAAFLTSVQARMPDQLGLAPLLADVLSVPVPETEESRSIDPQYRPERIADLVVRVIETSVRGPFILLVEEGHWADASSTAVLRRVAAATSGRPWALVVARRAEGEGLDLDLGTRVELPPLAPEVLRSALADSTRDAPLLPHELDGIVARAQGNPLFAEELLRLFRDVGSLEALPESLYAALDAEIDALDNQARRALRYASVLGRSFRRSVLDETLRADDADVDAATLDRLRTFLEPDGPLRLRFRNSMIRDAAYEGLAYRMRTRLHAAAGRAVERLSTDLDADADTLSLHYSSAGMPDKAWQFSRLAGDLATAKYASVEAVQYYGRALDAARRLPEVSSRERIGVHLSLGDAHLRLGSFQDGLGAYRAGRRLCDDPIRESELFLKEAVALHRMQQLSHAMRTLTRSIRLLDGAIDIDETERLTRRARAESFYAWCRVRRGPLKDALAWGRRAERDAEATGDPSALADAYDVLFAYYLNSGKPMPRPYGQLALGMLRESGNLLRQATTLSHLGFEAAVAGRCEEALAHYRDGVDVSRRCGAIFEAAATEYNIADLQIHLGRDAEAEAVLRNLVPVFRSLDDSEWTAVAERELGRVLVRTGRVEEGEQLARDARSVLVEVQADTDVSEADSVMAEGLIARREWADAVTFCDAALAQARACDARQAVRSLLRIRARAALELGELEAARSSLEEAHRLCEDEGRWDLGFVLVELADVLAALGDPAADVLRREGEDDLRQQGAVRPSG
jgi:class 3 adenylate cyclase/tetratricopeptide (TPR) repeat protein